MVIAQFALVAAELLACFFGGGIKRDIRVGLDSVGDDHDIFSEFEGNVSAGARVAVAFF